MSPNGSQHGNSCISSNLREAPQLKPDATVKDLAVFREECRSAQQPVEITVMRCSPGSK